jgi:hypothetical protein
MQKLTIQVPVYQFKCIVIIDDDIEKRINSFIKRHKWNETLFKEGEQVHGMAINPGLVHTYYIFYAIESITSNIITHEVSHLVDDVMGDKGMEDSETRAYLSGYINEKIFDYVLKNKLFINKWLKQDQLGNKT